MAENFAGLSTAPEPVRSDIEEGPSPAEFYAALVSIEAEVHPAREPYCDAPPATLLKVNTHDHGFVHHRDRDTLGNSRLGLGGERKARQAGAFAPDEQAKPAGPLEEFDSHRVGPWAELDIRLVLFSHAMQTVVDCNGLVVHKHL